jgi:hypothetical protein
VRINKLLFVSSRLGMAASAPDGACTPGSSQKKVNRRGKILSFAIVSALSLATASAGTLTTEDLAELVGSVTTSTDVDFLNLFTGGLTGPQPTWTLTETATSPTFSNWTGSLVGQLLGTPFDLSYTGTFMGNTVSWDTSGTYGVTTVTGGGSGTIAYPTSSSFLLGFSDALVSGSGTYSTSGGLRGTFNPGGTFQLGPPSSTDTEVGPLPISFDNVPTPDTSRYSYKRFPNGRWKDDFQAHLGAPIEYTYGFYSSATSFSNATAPEPKTYLLLGAGLLVMSFAMRKTRIKPMSAR